MEAIKILTDYGTPLAGRLVHYDATSGRMREISLRADSACALCGESPSITEPLTYQDLCKDAPTLQEIDVAAALQLIKNGFEGCLLDVREQHEHNWAHIDGCRLAPLSEFADHLEKLPRDQRYLIYCKVGQRSAHAGTMMIEAGFSNVINLQGGIMDWIREGGPVVTG